jgi:hypothetical protein
LRLLPFNLLCFMVSMVAVTRAAGDLVLDRLFKRELVWHKTARYRSSPVAKPGDVR